MAKSPFNEVERWVSQDRQRNPRKRSLHIRLRQSKDPLLGNRLGIVVAFLRATLFASAQGCPGISVFMLFSDVVAAGDPSVYLGKRASFGSTCLLEGRNEASPISASHPSHAHNGVKSPNNGTPPRAYSAQFLLDQSL